MPLLRQTAKRKIRRWAWRKNTLGRTALQCRRCGPPCGRFTRRRIRLPHGRSRRDVRLTRYRLSFTRASHPSPSSSRPRTTAFHAVDRGSNPLGDAKFGYHKERQGTKNLGVLAFPGGIKIPRSIQIQGDPRVILVFFRVSSCGMQNDTRFLM